MGVRRLVPAALIGCLLASCASLESRLRERSADAEDIEAGFASEQAAIRCLTAESCTWRHQANCEARLERMVREDPSREVRLCALRTLGVLCSDEARESILRLHPSFGRADRAAFVEVAGECPSADLHLALAQEPGPLPTGLTPLPATLEARVPWMQRIASLPHPRYQAVQARDRAERQLRFERAEALRGEEIETLRTQAEAALAAGRWRDAEDRSRTIALLGAPVGDLLRRIALQRLLEQKAHFEEELRAGQFQRAAGALDPHHYLLDPDVLDRLARERYQAVLPATREVARLAQQGKTAAAQRKLDDLPLWEKAPHPLNDLIRLQVETLVETLHKRAFDKAWNEAWLLRATRSSAYPIFLEHYGRGRWESEGLRMSRQRFETYMHQVGEHAPPEAVAQARRFELQDQALAGSTESAFALQLSYASTVDDHLRMCAGRNKDRVPAPFEDTTIDEMAESMEYLALHSTTVRARTQFRAKRDEGRRLAREFEKQRKLLPSLVAQSKQCAAHAKQALRFEGARPGTEANRRLLQRARETVSCLDQYWKMAHPLVEQGQKCLRYIREALSLAKRLIDEWEPPDR